MTTLDSPVRPLGAATLDAIPLPSDSRWEVSAQPLGDGAVLAAVWGELDGGTVALLAALVGESIEAGRVRVVLDLRRLYDLDAEAIAGLGLLKARLTARSGGLWLAAPRPWVRRLLDHMCLRGTFAVHPTVASALAQAEGMSAVKENMREASGLGAPDGARPTCGAAAHPARPALAKIA